MKVDTFVTLIIFYCIIYENSQTTACNQRTHTNTSYHTTISQLLSFSDKYVWNIKCVLFVVCYSMNKMLMNE
jgi:hypothetical protein